MKKPLTPTTFWLTPISTTDKNISNSRKKNLLYFKAESDIPVFGFFIENFFDADMKKYEDFLLVLDQPQIYPSSFVSVQNLEKLPILARPHPKKIRCLICLFTMGDIDFGTWK